MLKVFSILGIVGGLLCCTGDLFLDLKGRGNQKLGKTKNIESNWEKMSYWRFGLSMLLALFGDALVAFGLYSLCAQLYSAVHQIFAFVTFSLGLLGVTGGVFVHGCCCIQAVVYKAVKEKSNLETADFVLDKFFQQIMPAFAVAYISLLSVSVCMIICSLCGFLNVPKWFALCNSLVFMIFGLTLRKINPVLFQDLPGIIMPSFGLSMIGLMGLINLL